MFGVHPSALLPNRKSVFVGCGSGRIVSLIFDGKKFIFTTAAIHESTQPSWLLFKEPNFIYALDELTSSIRVFMYDRRSNEFRLFADSRGSAGVAHLAFNHDKTRIVGTAFGGDALDIWDTSAKNGRVKLIKKVPVKSVLCPYTPAQTSVQPHQAVLDPTGRYFAVPERGSDTVTVFDSSHDAFNVVNKLRVQTPGCGPRHAIFVAGEGGTAATHFVVLGELQNILEMYSVQYLPSTLAFTHVQTISTFGEDMPSKNPSVSSTKPNVTFAAAGEIIIASNQVDIYVSNRLTGNDEDSIVHFEVVRDAKDGSKASLRFRKSVGSRGIAPRTLSLSKDETILYSGNQNKGAGVLAFARATDGILTFIEGSETPCDRFRSNQSQPGPQFIMEV